MDTNSNKLKIS